MLIIGITGTIGAGKGAVVDFLVSQKGFAHYSMRNFLLEEIRRRGMPETRDSMLIVANEFRATKGAGYLVEQYLEKAKQQSHNVIIESIRTLGEIEILKKEPQAILLAVDASQKIRYERIMKRKSSTDNISFEKFVEDENKEANSTDPTLPNINQCVQLADVVIMNEGSLEELHHKIDKVVQDL